MQPVHVVGDRTSFEVQVENPKQPPVAAAQRRSFKPGDLLRQLGGQLKISERDRRIVADHARDGRLIVVLRPNTDLAMMA